jgi:hypothetical protein
MFPRISWRGCSTGNTLARGSCDGHGREPRSACCTATISLPLRWPRTLSVLCLRTE